MVGVARRAARALAQEGCGGDKHLIHVNQGELRAIRHAFGPAGRAGRRNPVTGLESFAPDDEAGAADDRFVGTNTDGSGYTMRLPLDAVPADAAAVAEFNLASIRPGATAQTTPIQDPVPAFSALASSSLFPIFGPGEEPEVAAVSPPPEAALRQPQYPASGAATSQADLPEGAVAVVRPDGRKLLVRNEKGQETELLSPKADLSDVGAAGRAMRQTYEDLLNGSDPGSANIYLMEALFAYLGHGGLFDYQREGNPVIGNLAEFVPGLPKFKQHPAYQPVSNFNVGLFSQQAGFSLQETLDNAKRYAKHFSSNYMPDQPDGLDPRVRTYIIQGWHSGERGDFDPPSAGQNSNQ